MRGLRLAVLCQACGDGGGRVQGVGEEAVLGCRLGLPRWSRDGLERVIAEEVGDPGDRLEE